MIQPFVREAEDSGNGLQIVAEPSRYCIGRTHMRRIALVIAAKCSEHALWQVAGRVGLALFEQCRDHVSFDREPGLVSRRKVSLARAA